MANCLVTKLTGAVDNDNLYKLGEMRFKCLIDTAGNTDYKFRVNSPMTISIVGNSGTIYDGANWEPTINNYIHATAGSIVSIPDKYSLYKFETLKTNYIQSENNILEDFQYCTELEAFYQYSEKEPLAGGNISSLKLLTKLQVFHQFSPNLTGNYKDIGEKPNLVELVFKFSKCGGNIAALWRLAPKLNYVTLGTGDSYGDVSGSPCTEIHADNSNNTNFSWTSGGRVAAGKNYFISRLSGNFGNDLDNMLVEQASLSAKSGSRTPEMNVYGTHTMSESVYTPAINTLKQKGFTVTINGEEQ